MAESRSLLDTLRSRTLVDCDTLDARVARDLGPFEDCTSNQAIAWGEILKPENAAIVRSAVGLAQDVAAEYRQHITKEALAVEAVMVALQLQVAPHIKGCIHIQVNPFDAYSASRTVAGAERIVQLCHRLDSSFDTSRLCIKIPCTWEGMQAARELERRGIKTLATTLFTMEQAALAGEARCRYIAPYVNELRAQMDPDYTDCAPLRQLCVEAQHYYEAHNLPTQVLPASLTTIEECMGFAGVKHITIAPPLLQQLASTSDPQDSSRFPSLFDELRQEKVPASSNFMNDESAFRMALTRSEAGLNEPKLCQALNIFCNMQEKLEDHMGRFM